MSEFRVGQRVDIEIRGVHLKEVPGRGGNRDGYYQADDGSTYRIPPQAKVTSAEPEHWPPRPGDVWADRYGELWFAYTDEKTWAEGMEVYLQAAAGHRFHGAAPLAFAQTRSPLTLKYRPEPSTEAPF